MITQARDATSMDAFITVCPFCCARYSTCTIIRSAWLVLYTASYAYLPVCLPVCLYDSTNLAPHISHVSQQTLYPYDCYDDQKVLEHVRRARGVKTIMWNMSILGLRNVECFTLGLLDWFDDSAPYRCNGMVATAWALKPKPLLLLPMFYDAYATPAPTFTLIYTLYLYTAPMSPKIPSAFGGNR